MRGRAPSSLRKASGRCRRCSKIAGGGGHKPLPRAPCGAMPPRCGCPGRGCTPRADRDREHPLSYLGSDGACSRAVGASCPIGRPGAPAGFTVAPPRSVGRRGKAPADPLMGSGKGRGRKRLQVGPRTVSLLGNKQTDKHVQMCGASTGCGPVIPCAQASGAVQCSRLTEAHNLTGTETTQRIMLDPPTGRRVVRLDGAS